jgi:hypothetical protein
LASWKVTDKKSRIRIQIRWSEVWIGGSGSVPKCQGSRNIVKNYEKPTENLVGLVIISIAYVGGGDEELEGVVLVHVQLPGLNQFQILNGLSHEID